MVNIFIDPVIVMTPPANESRDGIEAWLANLDIWLKEALSSTHYTWSHSVQVTDLLQDSGRFPDFASLRAWQRRYQLDINISQIVKNVNDFFRAEEFDLGSNLEKLGYLIEPEKGSIIIQPDQFPARWPDYIQDHMHLLLATTCACKHTEHTFASELHIATFALTEPTREIEVSAIILESIPDFVRNADNKIAQTFPLLFTPDDIAPLDIVSLWKQGERGLRKAIEQRYRQDWQSFVPQHLTYQIGSRFLESIDRRTDITEFLLNKIVRTMAGIIADKREKLKHKPHEVREREEPGTSQLIRSSDNATAWRITITPDGAGWRMHYWKIPAPAGSIIEFSNVLTKKDTVVIY